MDNQHRVIKGYRDLSIEEIALMNEIKEEGVRLEALIAKTRDHINAQATACNAYGLPGSTGDIEEADRFIRATPMTWLERAKADLQVGVMELVRSVAQPSSF